MKKEQISQENIEQWIAYFSHRDQDHQKRIEKIFQELEEMNKKIHLLGRSMLKLYKLNESIGKLR